MIAGFFAGKNDLLELPEMLEGITMDSLMDVLPAGFVKDARDLAVGAGLSVLYPSFGSGKSWQWESFELDARLMKSCL